MSFGIPLSGLDAASSSLDVIANNISNSNTTGFKDSRSNFADIYAQGSLSLSQNQIGEGVQVQAVEQQFGQGNISQTGNNLDLALNGNGFFIVKDGAGLSYTRNGTFSLDRQGFLVNGDGQQVQAYPAIAGGGGTFNQGALSSLQLTPTMNTPQPTSTGTLGVNLTANSPLIDPTTTPLVVTDPTTYTSTTSTAVYDSLGVQHTGSFYFTAVATPVGAPAGTAATWNVNMYVDGKSTGAPQTLTFNSSGALTAPSPAKLTFTDPAANLGNGAAALTMAFDFGTTTQFGSPFGVNSITQNGYSSGQLSGINVDASGIVSASYSNDQSVQVGQLALANFPDPNGLAPVGNSNWRQTYASGAPVQGASGTSTLGTIQSGALESSNVDMTKQLVDMNVAQRTFQANAQVITTNDQITQTILQIKA